jgi:hypothetical protein
MSPQEEDAIIRDLMDALDEAQRAGTPPQALAMLAWGCGVSAWYKPTAASANGDKHEHQRRIPF